MTNVHTDTFARAKTLRRICAVIWRAAAVPLFAGLRGFGRPGATIPTAPCSRLSPLSQYLYARVKRIHEYHMHGRASCYEQTRLQTIVRARTINIHIILIRRVLVVW